MTLAPIWPSEFAVNTGDLQNSSPIPFIWVIGESETGKTTFIASVDPVRPGEKTRTLITDLELSSATLRYQLPIDIVNIRQMTEERMGDKPYKAKDLFRTWFDFVMSIEPGQYSTLGVDPASDLMHGAFEYVGENPQLFNKTPERYKGELGIKSQWGDTGLFWKQIALRLSNRFQTVVFTSHIKDVYKNKVRVGKGARGTDFSEIATLTLWLVLERSDEGNKRYALVKKSRLSWMDWGDPAENRRRPVQRDLLPVRLVPQYPGQSYPELIAHYMAQPQRDYGELNIPGEDPALDQLTAEEQQLVEAQRLADEAELLRLQLEASYQQRVNDGKKKLLADYQEAGFVKNGAEMRKALTAIGPTIGISDYDPDRDIEIRAALERYFRQQETA